MEISELEALEEVSAFQRTSGTGLGSVSATSFKCQSLTFNLDVF